MNTVFTALLDRFDELHLEIEKALEGLPVEALDWEPGPDMNSLSVLIVHLTGAERYWVGDVARGEPFPRDRNAEFQVRGLEAAALVKRVRDLAAYERAAFEVMALADLEQERISPRDGKPYSVVWAIGHALEHTALHVGQVQLMSQLWKQR